MALIQCQHRTIRYITLPFLCLLLLLTSIEQVHAFCTQSPSPPLRITTSPTYLSSCTTVAEQLLQDYGFGRRLRTVIPTEHLPLTAELFDHGTWELCRIVQVEPPGKPGGSPRIRVESYNTNNDDNDTASTTRLVDLGQITTIWETDAMTSSSSSMNDDVEHELDLISSAHSETALQKLYHDVSLQSRNKGGGSLTKKQISKIVNDGPERVHTEEILRKALKCGDQMIRLVDSVTAMEYLYQDNNHDDDHIRRAVGGCCLARDADLGGRFKRMPCIYVGAEYDTDDTNDDDTNDESDSIQSLTFLNGGWLVVDESSRAGAEARKFAQRSSSTTEQQQHRPLTTVADERIAHRLECLAMGQLFAAGIDNEQQELEVDVREALKALKLPATPTGAQQALVTVGRWSSNNNVRKLEPWSPETLNAAKAYAQADRERRKRLAKACMSDDNGNDQILMEGRVDLTKIPSICIDAKSTTFRDDAIGIRPRSSTGRRVISEASKYEVLIHIADVSDIYLDQSVSGIDTDISQPLQKAAISRGMSRYDLPLGPLHLMPPIALKSLGFITAKDTKEAQVNIPNRCVTVWAYIDERNGKVLDMGLERTLISSPLALSYDEASAYLDTRGTTMDKNHPAYKATAVLALLERNLQAWAKQRKQSSEAARKREERLAAKQIVSSQNRQKFQRTRGHLLVDMSLDLYAVTVSQLLSKNKAPIPRASGSGADRAGRVATAPLRRLVDGMAQRQALSVLCDIGVPRLTVAQCRDINQQANDAMDRLANVRPLKGTSNTREQQQALAQLEQRPGLKKRIVIAIGTGRGNEVSIQGAVGKCQGVQDSFQAGEEVPVRIKSLNVEKGFLKVELVK